jgi:hypothetical protein
MKEVLWIFGIKDMFITKYLVGRSHTLEVALFDCVLRKHLKSFPGICNKYLKYLFQHYGCFDI